MTEKKIQLLAWNNFTPPKIISKRGNFGSLFYIKDRNGGMQNRSWFEKESKYLLNIYFRVGIFCYQRLKLKYWIFSFDVCDLENTSRCVRFIKYNIKIFFSCYKERIITKKTILRIKIVFT